MKKLKFALLLSLFANWSFAQLVNDGATITIKNGATLFVETDVQNNTTGTITVETGGTLEVQGSFTNAATALIDVQGTGKLKFTGASNSNLTTNTDPIRNLEVSKSNSTVTLVDNLTITNNLDFLSAGSSKLVLGANTATLNSAATITGNDADEYVNASAAGFLQKNYADGALAASAFTFPVGDATNYSPLATSVTGTAATANLKVNVVNAVHPSKPVAAESHLTRYWNVDQTGITNYSNAVTGTYVSADDLVGTASLVKGASYDGANWSYAGAATNGSSTVSGTLASATSPLASDFTGTNFYGKVDMKIFLQGAYNTATNEMVTTGLNAPSGTNWLETSATTSPYNVAPYNAESASVAAGFFLANPDIVDWVMLELRDPAAPSTTTSNRSSAFLKKDGTIVGLNGSALPLVENGFPTSVVAIYHRNHLTVRTKNAGTNVVSPPITIDSRTDTTAFYKNTGIANTNFFNLEAAPNGPGGLAAYGMWTGDVVKDGILKYNLANNDRAAIYTAIGGGSQNATVTGYRVEDVNLDGIVKYNLANNDRAIIYTNIGGSSQNATITQHN